VAFSQENVGGIVKSENPHKTIPQSASLTAPFTQGSLPPQKHSALIFICILFIGRAFFEPRDASSGFRFATKTPTHLSMRGRFCLSN